MGPLSAPGPAGPSDDAAAKTPGDGGSSTREAGRVDASGDDDGAPIEDAALADALGDDGASTRGSPNDSVGNQWVLVPPTTPVT